MTRERQVQVVDIQSSPGMTVNQSDEHQRNWEDPKFEKMAHSDGRNLDRSRSHLNFEITKGGVIQSIDKSVSITERMKQTLQERGIEDPNAKRKVKNIRTMINFIFGGSRERMREMAFGNQKVDFDNRDADNSYITRSEDIEHWAKDVYDFVCRKYGEQNIVGFYVHMDETNPHVHCSVLPITPDNKFSWKYWFGYTMEEGIKRLDELHNELAEANSKWGLERGDDIHKTGAKHMSTEEYRREAMKMERQIESGKSELQQIYAEINTCKKKIKSFETMISHLAEQKDLLEQQIAEIRAQLDASPDASNAELLQKLGELNAVLKDVTAKLDSRRKDLERVKQQLQDAQEEKDKLNRLNETLRNHSVEKLNAMEAQTRMEMTNIGMSALSKGFSDLLPTLSTSQLQKFNSDSDNDFDLETLNTIAERTEEVVSCAMLLFYGFVDKATTYCESHGGASSPGTGWGRDDDEDERRWRRRCLAQAAKMLGGRRKGRKR